MKMFLNLLIILLSISSTSCVTVKSPSVIESYFSPEIDSVYVEKINKKYRLNILLKNYSGHSNKVSNISLIIDGVKYKVSHSNESSRLVSEYFNRTDNYFDVRLNISTVLGRNNPLIYREIISDKLNNGIIVNRNKPSYLNKGTISYGNTNKSFYKKSKALLIGVSKYTSDFSELPYIDNDIYRLESILKTKGFKSNKVIGKIETSKIKRTLTEFIESSGRNDRLIIYVSSHGFPDRLLSDKGYIATSDCNKHSAQSSCLSLDFFTYLSKLAKKKDIKHLLIIVDSCFSGIGIVNKSSTIHKPIESIAYSSGIHMLTAGRANQTAQMEHKLKMSTFTYYLIEGLKGNADLSGGTKYNKDGIVTLSELFTYVNHTVVRQTNGKQIPSLGRIYGEGEMIFKIK